MRVKTKESLRTPIQRMIQSPLRSTQTTQPTDAEIECASKALLEEIDRLDTCSESDDELETLKSISRSCHSLVNAARHITSSSAFHGATKVKEFENIRKIARYWDMCNHMARICRRHNYLFSAVVYCPMPPFQSQLLGDSLKCFVHAEVQIVTFYTCKTCDPTYHLPRVIGTSKAACYLCESFIRIHGQFFVARSHGQLFPRWNIPDLQEYGSRLHLMRETVQKVDQDVLSALKRHHFRRPYPMTSNASLISSPLSSNTSVNSRASASKGSPIISDQASKILVSDRFSNSGGGPEDAGTSSPREEPPRPRADDIHTRVSLQKDLTRAEPQHAVITSIEPFHIRDGNLSVSFILEPRSPSSIHPMTLRSSKHDEDASSRPHQFKKAIVQIEESHDQDMSSNVVDVKMMKDGEERIFARHDDEDNVVMILDAGSKLPLCITCTWIKSV